MYYGKLRGNVDALVFTAGIGENISMLRSDVVLALHDVMNLSLNKEINDNIGRNKKISEGKISNPASNVDIFVIPTDEESIILEDTYNLKRENKIYKKVK